MCFAIKIHNCGMFIKEELHKGDSVIKCNSPNRPHSKLPANVFSVTADSHEVGCLHDQLQF